MEVELTPLHFLLHLACVEFLTQSFHAMTPLMRFCGHQTHTAKCTRVTVMREYLLVLLTLWRWKASRRETPKLQGITIPGMIPPLTISNYSIHAFKRGASVSDFMFR